MLKKELGLKITTNMKIYIILFLLFLSSTLGIAQTKESALVDANITAKATLKEDFKTVLTYSHPNILKASGGMEVMIPQIEGMFTEMKKEGFKFVSAEVESVSDVIQEQGELRCFVKNINVMEISGKTMKSTSYLLGFFLDGADHWVFVEAEKMKNPQTIQTFFPNFKTNLDIPPDDIEILE